MIFKVDPACVTYKSECGRYKIIVNSVGAIAYAIGFGHVDAMKSQGRRVGDGSWVHLKTGSFDNCVEACRSWESQYDEVQLS